MSFLLGLVGLYVKYLLLWAWLNAESSEKLLI